MSSVDAARVIVHVGESGCVGMQHEEKVRCGL